MSEDARVLNISSIVLGGVAAKSFFKIKVNIKYIRTKISFAFKLKVSITMIMLQSLRVFPTCNDGLGFICQIYYHKYFLFYL